MLNDQRALVTTSQEDQSYHGDVLRVRDVHALTPPHPPPRWETGSHISSSLSMAATDGASSENFTTISREFSTLLLAGSNDSSNNNNNNNNEDNINGNNLSRNGEEETQEETNPLAIVQDNNSLDPVGSPTRVSDGSSWLNGNYRSELSMQRVKREEVESKVNAWQTAKVAKINNRFKREDAVINGWECEQVQKSSSWMKKVERKLEEKRARALEKMQNEVAKAHRKAEERRASAEAKRGTKVTRILEVANLMRAVGRAPAKLSFF